MLSNLDDELIEMVAEDELDIKIPLPCMLVHIASEAPSWLSTGSRTDTKSTDLQASPFFAAGNCVVTEVRNDSRRKSSTCCNTEESAREQL